MQVSLSTESSVRELSHLEWPYWFWYHYVYLLACVSKWQSTRNKNKQTKANLHTALGNLTFFFLKHLMYLFKNFYTRTCIIFMFKNFGFPHTAALQLCPHSSIHGQKQFWLTYLINCSKKLNTISFAIFTQVPPVTVILT